MHIFKLITLALALAPVAAHAQSQGLTARVKISDIDLHSPAGRAILARRVNTAAEQVCLPVNTSTVMLQTEVAQCRAAAVRGAEVQIAALAQGDVTMASR